MPFSSVRHLARRAALLLALAAAWPAFAAPAAPVATADNPTTFDQQTGELVLSGNARLTYEDIVLTADTIRYDRRTNLATATGHFILSSGPRRLVADEGTYNLADKTLKVRNLRLGQFPFYLTGETVEGTIDRLVVTNATIFFRENAAYAPSLHADRIIYERGRIASGHGLRLGLLGGRFLSLPQFEHDLTKDLVSYINGKVGYRRNLGALVELGAHVPIAPGLKAGADVGLYTARGIMAGPSGSYTLGTGDRTAHGALGSGYINDHGDRLADILGRPVPADRGYVTWWHRQQLGPRLSLNAQVNYWSDSEILRDFRPKEFFRVQQPDTFIEGAYTGDDLVVSLFTRLHPNRYHRVQERLPELTLDLLPSALPGGFVQRLHASLAVLEEDAYLTSPGLRSRRADAAYGLERTFAPTPWLAVTPVVGGRLTHYDQATGGKDDYTRALGEIGFDAVLRASGRFDYQNPLWEIDGLRHLLEPRLSYRYAPEANDGRRWIPAIDRRVFATYLQPLSILDQRSVDDLDRTNTLRLSLGQVLQTRAAGYGSRDLVRLDVAADYRFSYRNGRRPLSDFHTALAITPASWLKFEVYERFTPQTSEQQELNYAVELSDQDWWSARLASHYLRGEYEEYALDYSRRVTEVFGVYGRWRYDTLRSRFNEQTYGVSQRLGQTWALRYEISFTEGRSRESNFGFNLEVDLLKF